MIKAFLFSFLKRWIGYIAGKLLSPEAVTELLLDLARAHVERGDTSSTGALVDWLEDHLSEDGIAKREDEAAKRNLK